MTGEDAPAGERAVVCADAELAPGDMRAVRLGPVSVVVLRKRDGSLRALRNRCTHQGGVLSEGFLEPVLTGGEVGDFRHEPGRECVICPLHGFEFDVDTGLGIADPARDRVRTYPVHVEDGVIVVERAAHRPVTA